MYKAILHSMENLEFFGLTGFFISLTFFIGVIIWTVKQSSEKMDRMANLPFEPDYEVSENDKKR